MKTKNILLILMVLALAPWALSSCISDDSTEGNITLPTLSITGADSDKMPVKNVYLGNDCVIKPEIKYSGDETDLTYSWKIGTYANSTKGELEEVSTERDLDYKFTSGGSYYAHLTVTDGKVGQVVEYQINVNRTFEEGYLLSSTDADGSGNLAFVKIMTPEEIEEGVADVIIEHSLETMNEGYSEKGLVRAVKGAVTYPKDLTRILVSTQEHCYVIDPNNFTIISDIRYAEIDPNFRATHFMPDAEYVSPYAYDKNSKKFIHINLTNMFPFEYKYFEGAGADDILVGKYSYWGSEMLSLFYLDYTKNTVSMFNSYASYYDLDNFTSTGSMLDGDRLITAFGGYSTVGYNMPTYIISQNKTSGELHFWTDTKGWASSADVSSFSEQSLTPTSDTAIPGQGVQFVGSPKYQRYYYPVGNSIYAFLTTTGFALPGKSQYAYRFSDTEEITCMEVNYDTDELYVGTYDSTTQRGSFYIFSCRDLRTDNSANTQPTASYRNCAGRISSIMYKPSIQ